MHRYSHSMRLLFATLISVVLALILSACMTAPQAAPQQQVTKGQLLLDDDFSSQKDWDIRTADWAYMNIINEGYRMWLTRNVYLYGLYYESFTDTIMEADALLLTDRTNTMYGLRCRTNVNNMGNGYYFMLSADGAFSIRYGAGNAIEPLVQWQDHRAIRTDGRVNTIRVVCSGDYLALYVNDQFVADTVDSRYSIGLPGLALALPEATTIDNPADVVFDNVKIWSVNNSN